MKRRSFINRSAAGITGAAIASSSIASLLVSCTGNNKELTVALIGCSGGGYSFVVKALKDMPTIKIKNVFDFDREKATESTRSINNALAYLPEQVSDMDSIFSDKEIDAVFIFMPEHWRALATIRACQAGKDVYIDSLPSHSVWEGQQMVRAASKHKRVIQCGFSLRSDPSVIAAKDYINQGELGQLVHVKIFSLNDVKQSSLVKGSEIPDSLDWDNWLGPVPYQPFSLDAYDFAHGNSSLSYGRMSMAGKALDLARMLVGDPGSPYSVYGYSNMPAWISNDGVPERQVVTYDFETFSMACEAGSTYGYMKSSPVVIGDKTLALDWLLQPNRVEIYGTKGLMYLDLQGGWQVFGNENPTWGMRVENRVAHIHNFFDCIRNRDLPNSNIELGSLSSAMVHMGNISCQAGNKQLLFDSDSGVFTNNNEANDLLRTTYREGYEMPEKI
jgi:predicted dehydrogenase